MNEIFAVYGAAGCGRSLMPVAKEELNKLNIDSKIYFVDDLIKYPTVINSHIALNYQDFKKLSVDKKKMLIAISDSKIRQDISNKILLDGINLWSVKSDQTIIMDEVKIGDGSALSPFVTIGSNVSIGKCFHANLYSYIEHDCIIGDFVTLAPRVNCNGNVHIHDHAYIGTGAVIKQGTSNKPLVIGEGAIVGMGAVVTKDVPPGVTVIGNPARPLMK